LSLKLPFIYGIILLVTVSILGACDSTTAPADILKDSPAIVEFDISPSRVNFTPADGVRDTTVNIQFSGRTSNHIQEQSVILVINRRNSGELFREEELAITSDGTFDFELDVETNTTFFNDFEVFTRLSGDNSAYAEGKVSIQGFSEFAPEILEINNPESVQLPSSGESARSVSFRAKVSDVEGLVSIEGVYLRLISRSTGELSGSPFRLYDNGSNGDLAPNDSLFTRVFQFNSGNNSDFYDVEYFAIDRGGLISDTLRTTFRITQ